MTLVFVLAPNVVENFEKCMSQQFFVDNEELLPHLIDYFEGTWIGRSTKKKYDSL